MTDTQMFIDAGWWTVPFSGEMYRNSDGSKKLPAFEPRWNVKYKEALNTTATPLGGVFTGPESGIVAVDCDSQRTLDLCAKLSPDDTPIFVSKGKPKGGGTLVFAYEPTSDLTPFRTHNDAVEIDFFTDGGMVFLPTSANKTKEPWDEFPDPERIRPIPPQLYVLLKSWEITSSSAQAKPEDQRVKQETIVNYLSPQIEQFLQTGKFSKGLFKVLTPYEYRTLPEYEEQGYLHPDQVPEGSGSDYLMRVSAILGADSSVSEAVYYSMMREINDMWKDPLPIKRLDDTITSPMVQARTMINGSVVWRYDERWKTKSILVTNKLGESLEMFFDDIRHTYYVINHTLDSITKFLKDSDLFSYISTVGNAPPDRKTMKTSLHVVRTVSDPQTEFGFYEEDEYTTRFNLFKQTPYLAVLNNPQEFMDKYQRPETTLKYLRSLIPDHDIRMYVLRFLRHKLKTFEYSPVILYLLGVPGSGKDTLVDILGKIIGTDHIAKPTSREFLEQYNGWIVDKYFIQLDEYGNQLSRLADKEEALGKIKLYSGKQDIQVRQMRADGHPYRHSATIVMTANSNPLIIEEDDRRLCLIATPNKLENEEWVKESGGISAVHKIILGEVMHLCYYLATEVEEINPDDYVSPPDTAQKREMIMATLPPARKLAYMLQHSMFDELKEMGEDYGVYALFSNASQGYFEEDTLYDLFAAMTGGEGTKRGLAAAMKQAGITKKQTVGRQWSYVVQTLAHYSPSFEAQ